MSEETLTRINNETETNNKITETNENTNKITESQPQSITGKNMEELTTVSESSLDLTPDSRHVRRIIAEDPAYNLATVAELEHTSLQRIIDNFAFNASMYKSLKPSHKKKMLEKLSLDIPLKVITDVIEDGLYWKRKSVSRWVLCDVSHFGGSWKRLFLEKNLEEIIETFVPDKTDRCCLEDTVSLSAPYIHRLIITQLLPPIKTELNRKSVNNVATKDDGSDDESDIEEVQKIDHLYLGPIVSKLPNLTELRLSYDVKNCGMNFEWNIFQFTVNDCLQLAKCVAAATHLKVFHLTRSRVDCDRCRVIISNLLDHPGLIELDFSHNHIGDRGARALGKLINNRSQLEILKIANNQIKSAGAQAIGFALLKNTTLKVLDMRLNRILDEGGQAICKALITNFTLCELNLAANEMTEPTAAMLAQVIQVNPSLTSIDVSNNKLGPDGGKQIQEAMADNRILLFLDLRFTDCGDESIFSISQIISFNQKLQIYDNELDEEIRKASPYIIADQQKALFGKDSLEELKTSSLQSTAVKKGLKTATKVSHLFKTLSDENTLSI